MSVRVSTGSRLHFGLFRLPGQRSPTARQCGGVGLMIEQPGLIVRAEPASSWSFTGPLTERVRDVAAKVASAYALGGSFHVEVESSPPEHVGLGTGTQLGLAVGVAMLRSVSSESVDVLDLARRLGRGQRSALGIHGFMQGGFLVEAGKGPTTALSPLVAQVDFPEPWRVLVVVPPGQPGRHGRDETQAFADLAQLESKEVDVLCRLTLLGMLPAMMEADLPAFGESLFEFNRRVGEMFQPAQGGVYGHRTTDEIVSFLRQQMVSGCGQSSWGPTVFAVVQAERAERLAGLVRDRFGFQAMETLVTRARNQGASIADGRQSEPEA